MKINQIKILPNEENGFTLIELMVSMTVFLIVIAAVFSVMRFATLQSNTINTRTDALKGAKIALSYVRRDAINAGLGFNKVGGLITDDFISPLLNIPPDPDSERDFLTGILAGNNVNSNSLNGSVKTDSIAFVSRDLNFNNKNLLNFSQTSKVGDSVEVQTPQSIENIVQPNDLYLFELSSGTSQIVGMVTSLTDNNTLKLSPGDPLNINQSANGIDSGQSLLVSSGSVSGTIKKMNLVCYSVTEDGILVRKTFGNQTEKDVNTQIEVRELILGVKDFQVKYLLDDGTTTDDPSNGNNGQENQKQMNRIVEIQVSITVVQEDTGLPQATEPITFKEFISTRNLRYSEG